jgi:hypothetical protein
VSAVLAAEIEEFVTLPTPYALDVKTRVQLRESTRGTALAHLLGDLAELIEHGVVDTESVTAAIRAALAAGTAHQREQLRTLLAPAS